MDDVVRSVNRYGTLAVKASKRLPKNRATHAWTDAVEEFRHRLPVYTALRNSALADRHWTAVEEIVGKKLRGGGAFDIALATKGSLAAASSASLISVAVEHADDSSPVPLARSAAGASASNASLGSTSNVSLARVGGSLETASTSSLASTAMAAAAGSAVLTMGILEHLDVSRWTDEIVDVSATATNEAALIDAVAKLASDWEEAQFVVHAYKDQKDTYILAALDDTWALLDDSQVSLANLQASRHRHIVEQDVEVWTENLAAVNGVIDHWVALQRLWMYLEPISSGVDIQRQLPSDARVFNQVDKEWRQLMRAIYNRPDVLPACLLSGVLAQRTPRAARVQQP